VKHLTIFLSFWLRIKHLSLYLINYRITSIKNKNPSDIAIVGQLGLSSIKFRKRIYDNRFNPRGLVKSNLLSDELTDDCCYQ